jgi:hypothetical protein
MNLRSIVRTFLTLPVVNVPGVNAGLTFNGSIPDSSLVSQLNILNANAAGDDGWDGLFSASAAASATLTGLGNVLFQFTNGGAVTITLDYAYNIVNALDQPVWNGKKFSFQITTNAGTTIATPTLSSASGGVTLAGVTSVLAASSRWYQGQITQLTSTSGIAVTAGTTFTSLTRVGSTNAFTVALGTNAIVPVAGQVVFLNVTTGTLPSGWYPIAKVTSATSFVILTPNSQVWTMTAGSVGLSTAAPATFSPLVTITGLWALVVSTASV